MALRTPAQLAALVLLAVALPLGGRWFGAVLVLVAAAALVAFSAVLSAVGPRPVVAAAAIAAVGTPLRLLVDPAARLGAVPAMAAGMLLSAYLLTIVSGRRSQIATAMGATAFCGLLIGSGAGGAAALRGIDNGFRWALCLLVLTVLPEAVGLIARRLRPAQSGFDDGARAVAMAAGAGALLMAANPPFAPAIAAAVLAVCAVAAFAAGAFAKTLPDATGGELLRPFAGLLLAAPAVYLLTTVVQN